MILVTGGTGLVGAHLLLHIIASDHNGHLGTGYLSIFCLLKNQIVIWPL
jgi:nucleoside-diphosphate-sugar epimerase